MYKHQSLCFNAFPGAIIPLSCSPIKFFLASPSNQKMKKREDIKSGYVKGKMRSIWVPKKSFEQPSSLNLCKLLLLSYEQHTRTQQHQLIIVLTFRSKILILFHHPQSSVIKIHWKMIDFQFEFQPPNVEGLRPSCKGWRTTAAGLAQWRCHGAMIKMMI